MNYRYFKHCILNLFIIIILGIISVLLLGGLRHIAITNGKLVLDINNPDFRRMNITCNYDELKAFSDSINADTGELMIVCCCLNNGEISRTTLNSITKAKYIKIRNYLIRNQPEQFLQYKQTYNGILNDIKYFPIPRSNRKKEWVNYVDSWNNERTYKGNRTHEGTDIMGDINKDGIYPVVSVSDGCISSIGWLELGGWRIGITSPNGIYYYYAHLDSYAKDYKKGDAIKAGDIIGYMGSTGYSKVEGTKNKFPAHLHFGIYILADDTTEVSVNPYNFLKTNENNSLIYSY